ncbi:MAG: pirin family protein [Sphaerochaeta sp.]
MQRRPIKRITGGAVQYDGAGVKLVRLIGYNDTKEFDPFLMLDAFDSKDSDDYIKGFPWHPHRGIETVTYLIDGEIEHGDSLGNRGTINEGCCQWMTGGSGIIHQEMPQKSDSMLGCQLWINLPKKDKMTEPAYRDIRAHQIPLVRETGTEVRVISGSYHGTDGPEQGDYVKTTYLDVKLDANQAWSLDVPTDHTLFIYVVRGSLHTDGQEVPFHRAALFGQGDTLSLAAGSEGARFFLFAGKPLSESIAWAGPIVMNTPEELRLARQELQDGTFIKHK